MRQSRSRPDHCHERNREQGAGDGIANPRVTVGHIAPLARASGEAACYLARLK